MRQDFSIRDGTSDGTNSGRLPPINLNRRFL
jgi:hypothetical protein